MSEAPRTIRVIEDLGGITVVVPRRPSAFARFLVDKTGQAGVMVLVVAFILSRSVDGVLAIVFVVLILAFGWVGKQLRDRFVAGAHQQLRVTPQRVLFPEGDVLLEAVRTLRLDLDRGRLMLHTTDEQVLPVLGGLDYAELIWLRDFLQQHITQRCDRLGDAMAEPAVVPAALQAMREP